MDGNKDEIEQIFCNEYVRNMKESVDKQFRKQVDIIEEDIRTLFEKMVGQQMFLLEEARKKVCKRFGVDQLQSIGQIKQSLMDLVQKNNSQQKQKSLKEQIDRCNQIEEPVQIFSQMMARIEQVNQQVMKSVGKIFERLELECISICSEYTGKLEYVKQLRQCTDYISINDSNKIDYYRNKIKWLEEKGGNYQIELNFDGINSRAELNQQLVDMVDQLDVNDRVGGVQFRLDDSNQLNTDLITKMVSNYHNLWSIVLNDSSNQVNDNAYDWIKIMLRNSTLLYFDLHFDSCLYNNGQGLKMLKECNEVMAAKTHLEYLRYGHQKVDMHSYNKQEIKQMVEYVSSL